MKNIVALSYFLLINIFLYAQTDPIAFLQNEINQIPYVIEGNIIDVKIFPCDQYGTKLSLQDAVWEEDFGTFILDDGSSALGYSEATIQICRIYKGEITTETVIVESFTENLQIYLREVDGDVITEYNYFHPSHGSDPIILPRNSIGKKRVFFCEESFSGIENHIALTNIASVSFTPEPTQTFVNRIQNVYARFYFPNSDYPIEDLFYSDGELQDFMNQFTTFQSSIINYCEGADQPKQKRVLPPMSSDTKVNDEYLKNLSNYNDWLNNNNLKRKWSDKNSTKANEKLTLEIDNPRLTNPNSSDPYLEFDILASSPTTTTYFDNFLIRLEYSTNAFARNMVSKGLVTITVDPAFSSATYTDPQTDMIDQTASVLGIPFGVQSSPSSINRVLLNNTPRKVLTITMKIKNCNRDADIDFIDETFTDLFSFFSTTSTAANGNVTGYTTTNYNGQISDKTCNPIISSYTQSARAGTGDIFTITGKYFGNTKSKGTVVFANANTGGLYPYSQSTLGRGIEQYDVVSWSDNLIEIRLPSVIDSITDNVNDPDYRATPGSGKFIVLNKFGAETESTTPIDIPFALYQVIDVGGVTGFNKLVPELSGQNANNGYTIHLNPAVISAYSGITQIVTESLKEWACASEITWELGANMTQGSSLRDGISMINLNSNISAAARTSHQFIRCMNNANPPQFYLKSFDIEISSTINWQVSTGNDLALNKNDLSNAVGHEIGHGHLLTHTNNTDDILFYQSSIGFLAANQRRLIMSSPSLDGAIYITDNNINGIAGCFGAHVKTIPINCNVSIKELDNKNLDIMISPNPISNGDISVQFNLEEVNDIYFFIYNSSGSLVKNSEKEIAKNVNYLISTDDLSEGVYYLQIVAGNKREVVKFVKN